MSRRRSLARWHTGDRVRWQNTWYLHGEPRTHWRHGVVIGRRGDHAVIQVAVARRPGPFVVEVWEPLLQAEPPHRGVWTRWWSHDQHRRTVS